jgi:excinuclease ABC subunit A
MIHHPMSREYMRILIEGAREHNLKGINVEFGEGLTVVTGVSGSGKTSLVFDTLYHEARRRFLEVFELGSPKGRLSPANVDSITGLGPAVAVGQNLLNRNPASTLATASGLHPFLRLLYAHFGERICTRCGTSLSVYTEDEIVECLEELVRSAPLRISVPLLHGVAGSHHTLLAVLATKFERPQIWVDGHIWQGQKLKASRPHDIELQIAEVKQPTSTTHLRELVQQAGALGVPSIVARWAGGARTLSRVPVCASCGTWFGDLRPVDFHSACPHCRGAGCGRCYATGLPPQAAAVRWSNLAFPELLKLSVDEALSLFMDSKVSAATPRLRIEIVRRLEALRRVGLGYISLNRPSPTISRGEAQRVRLATILISRLEDMLHVLDEPTVGQHPADVQRLLPAFRELAGPVVFVEHERIAAAGADYAIDIGPGAGHQGGQVVFRGTSGELWQADTATGRYFSLRDRIPFPVKRSEPDRFITIKGANLRNLQGIDVPIPFQRLTVVTGVSGSGKSTLVEDVLVSSLTEDKPIGCVEVEGPHPKPLMVDQSPIGLNPRSNPATYTKLSDIVRDMFAAATGLSPSHFSFNRPEGACPTCGGLGSIEVAMRYLPAAWIRCAECEGKRFTDEVLAAKLPATDSGLSIAGFYKLSIDEVRKFFLSNSCLTLTKRQTALKILDALCDIGLGYLSLGQSSPTLSGGEAQRVKLARYLGKKSLTKELLVLDEPTTGLHPQDLAGLIIVLNRLVDAGATIVIVEHNTDIMRAADWIIDLGPGAGPQGGRLLYAGVPEGLLKASESQTARMLQAENSQSPAPISCFENNTGSAGVSPAGIRNGSSIDSKGEAGETPALPETANIFIHHRVRHTRRMRNCSKKQGMKKSISIQQARVHNLQNISVDIPKGKLTVVTGVSGSGKSSLVHDVLETEAQRRFLETLSLYERQTIHEGPEAEVESVSGLGVALTIGADRLVYSRRATVGTATEISHHLAVLLAGFGRRNCLECGSEMKRHLEWICPVCGAHTPLAAPRHFASSTYSAACVKCNGIGSMQTPNPRKLIIHPEKPLAEGAMHSPGFFPNGYLGKPFNGGYYMLQALGSHHGFDPHKTPWNEMSADAQHDFLFGSDITLTVHYQNRKGQSHTYASKFPGFYGFIRDWDVGGTYTDNTPCPACHGTRLRPEYLAVKLSGFNVHELSGMTLRELKQVMKAVKTTSRDLSLPTIHRRLEFLTQVGLGYLHLDRVAGTLSAGEAQRIRLASVLGSGLTSLTLLLDEPTRGLHPSEVDALLGALKVLRDEGNTVVVVEHDPQVMRAADYLIDMGPEAGQNGGRIVARGTPEKVAQAKTHTGRWLRGECELELRKRRQPRSWFTVRGARANNLKGERVDIPLGVLAGVCGVSGSGKSTLVADTIGRALAPRKLKTSVAYEPMDPGEYDSINGAPSRTVLVDQSKAGLRSPATFLDLVQPLQALYAASPDALALGLGEEQFAARCSACGGGGILSLDMTFLPDVHMPCETCRGTGYIAEAWEVRLKGLALPEVFSLTLDEIADLFGDDERLMRPLQAARDVGLGYLVLRQPGHALSGGEAQRLKIAGELCRKIPAGTLYLLDEPTIGQHLEDVRRLTGILHRLVDEGNSVIVVEHHIHLLASCDWLMELGPLGGPGGGHIIATGTPEMVAAGKSPTADFLRDSLIS